MTAKERRPIGNSVRKPLDPVYFRNAERNFKGLQRVLQP